MDRAVEIVKEYIEEHAEHPISYGEVELEKVFDAERGHYALMMQGWSQGRRVHGIILHIDVKGDKVYVQHDGTRDGTRESIANRLVDEGISPDRIVLCYQPPYVRAETKFAVA